MQSVHPYLNFPGNAEEAVRFYCSIFGVEPDGWVRFRDMAGEGMELTEADMDKVAHVSFPLADGTNLMASDVVGSDVGEFTVGTNTFIYLETDSADEAIRVFGALSAGGRVVMPLAPAAWAELYGVGADRFGVQWMISYTGDVEFVMP